MMKMRSCKIFLFIVASLCVSSALGKALKSRRSQYWGPEKQRQLEELITKKQRRSAALLYPEYDDRNELPNGLTSEEREREGDNFLNRNGFITIHNKPNYRHTIRRNGSLMLECDVSGQPPPSVYWLKNGEPVTSPLLADPEELTNRISSVPVLVNNDGLASTRSRHFIDCASPADEAIYSCVAETEKDRTVSSTYVRVTGQGPNAESCQSTCRPSSDSAEYNELPLPTGIQMALESFRPPRILLWSGTYVHESGKDAQLLCRAEGTNVHVRWYNEDGVMLGDGDKYVQLESGDLVVRNLEWRDMGGYFCRATNICGRDEQFTFLYPVAPES